MSLPRIFIDSDLSINQSIQLPVATGHYVKNVLRLKSDQQILLFNNKQSAEYTATIEIQGKHVRAKPISKAITFLDSPLQTILLQAIGKPEHVDLVIQKATELGISQIYLFNSQR
ncbi:MAG: RsmE family RNA methyltransferase, partial [Gammaproteobacteria bacterium]|nr:RsmE family RNA methyltransferase [Gammaproteobacteria bacterium]